MATTSAFLGENQAKAAACAACSRSAGQKGLRATARCRRHWAATCVAGPGAAAVCGWPGRQHTEKATAATGSPKPSPRKRNERESAQARCRRCRFRGRGPSPSLAWSSARSRRRAVRAGWAAAAFGGPGRCHASNTAVTPARPRQGFAEAQRRCRLRWPARGLRGRHGVSCAAPVPLWAGDPKRRAQTSTTVAVPRRVHRDFAEARRRYRVRAWPPPACCRALTRAIPIWHIHKKWV